MICYLFLDAKSAQKDPFFVFNMLRNSTLQYREKYECAFQDWCGGFIFANKDTIDVLKNISPYKSNIDKSEHIKLFGFDVIKRSSVPFGMVDIR